jgi:hypothetical protein
MVFDLLWYSVFRALREKQSTVIVCYTATSAQHAEGAKFLGFNRRVKRSSIMKSSQIERSYPIAPHALFGACLTALGQIHARIEHHDVEQGLIVAQVGGAGPFAAAPQLTLRIAHSGTAHARLVIEQPACSRGAPRAVTMLIEAIDRLLGPI